MERPIFDCINEAITEDGTLSLDFQLPLEEMGEVRFAPGALDGIFFYHGGIANDDSENSFELIVKAVLAASADDMKTAMNYAGEFAEGGRMLPHIDEIQNYILDNQDKIDSKKIIDFALDLILTGTKTEEVKLGLSILELYNIDKSEEVKEFIRILALSDEFTLFAAFLMRRWKNSTIELWDIAKRVYGWGRVHIMRIIEPEDNEEIEKWMVINGVKNGVYPSYTGIEVFVKTHYEDRINEDLSLEMYRGMAEIMSAILDEGPILGISNVDDIDCLFEDFINATAKRNDLTKDDYRPCEELLEYMKDNNGVDGVFDELIEKMEKLLASVKIKENSNLS